MKLSERNQEISILLKNRKRESKSKFTNISESKIVKNIKINEQKLEPLNKRYDEHIDVKYPVIEK